MTLIPSASRTAARRGPSLVAAGWILAATSAAPAVATPPEAYGPPPASAAERLARASERAGDGRWLRLRAVEFDPLEHGEPRLDPLLPDGPELRAPAPAAPTAWLVQFREPVSALHRERLAAAGAEILGYVPNHALLVRAPGPAPPAVADARWVGRFGAGYKLDGALFRLLPDGEAAAGHPVVVEVLLHRGEAPHALVSAVRTVFPTIAVRHVKTSHPPRVSLGVPRATLARAVGALVRDGAVQWVGLGHPLERHNDNAVWIGQSYDRASGPGEALESDPKPYAASATVWAQGLTGAGQIVAVADTGLETGTCFFEDPANPLVPQSVATSGDLVLDPSHRKILALNAPDPAALTHDGSFRHGTHVAATIVGDSLAHAGTATDPGHDHGDGVAPMAKLIFEDLSAGVSGTCSTTIAVDSIQDLLDQVYRAGARIASNSWGSTAGGYGPEALESDQGGWDREDLLVFFSAGNKGAAGVVGNSLCKNCVVVGATENWDATFSDALGTLDPENMAAFSSRGPTPDGRTKPDLTAPGHFVHSHRFPTQYIADASDPLCAPEDPQVCFPSFGGCYRTDTSQPCSVEPLLGTSHACPIAAGLGVLVRQYFEEGFYPTGQPVAAHARNPTAALVKAVLINGARNMTGRLQERRGTPVDFGALEDAPSPVQGWGRVMLEDALHFVGDARSLLLTDVPHAQGLATGAWVEVHAAVVDGAQSFEATLVWTDAPSTIFSTAALVNDLDLEVLAPDGTIFRGNQWGPDDTAVPGDKQSQPNPTDRDAVNNVEGVLLLAPETGVYTLRVRGASVPGADGITTQGFALVVTGAVEPGAARAVPDGTFGAPMRASRADASGTAIDLSWDVATCRSTDYHVLWGDLASVATHTVGGAACDLGNDGTATWTDVPPGSAWFLLVGDDGADTEGPWGTASGGASRNAGAVSGLCGLTVRDDAATCF